MELGLERCANTKIGNKLYKGCSDGEKRRVSIGVQLFSNPSVLFLDEPTTGLDAASALQLVRILKYLAREGRTVIITSKLMPCFTLGAILAKWSSSPASQGDLEYIGSSACSYKRIPHLLWPSCALYSVFRTDWLQIASIR